MKFNFIQKKGVVVALATALSVASFGITALAGINFVPVNDEQSLWFQSQSDQSVMGKLADNQSVYEEITLTRTPGSETASCEVSADLYTRNNQSDGWILKRVSGSTSINASGWRIIATDNGEAIFALQRGQNGLPVKTWKVTASGWSSTPSYVGGGGAVVTKPDKDDTKDDAASTVPVATVVVKNGKQIAVDKDGNAIKKSIVSIDGKEYVTNAKGVIVKSAFATTKDGVKVYAKKNGQIVKGKAFTVKGKKYVADATGAIAIKKFATTRKGNTVYANKNGVVVKDKVFKVGGKQYVANKNGVILKNQWVTKGKTQYFCNKKGVVTKTKPVKNSK